VSASRSTDIPAFYAEWLFHRLNVGYSAWTNPFNGIRSYVSYANTKFIVFWSKNPRPLLNHLDELQERGIGCYVQYTLNDYEEEGLERGVRPLAERIETFKMLVQCLGKGAVVWRFDPLILTDKIDMDKLLRKIENIGDQLIGYTEKLVFSFADIISYRKVKANLEKNHINYVDWSKEQMIEFASQLVKLNKEKGWNYTLATCGEAADLQGVEHNHCVDDRLIVRFGYKSPELMHFLGAEFYQPSLFEPLPEDAIGLSDGRYAMIKKDNRDKGQRIACGCMKSKDIGEYNTCPHLCEYCYANSSKDMAVNNWRQHKLNPLQDTITGK
jgi:DNA repair photolyase